MKLLNESPLYLPPTTYATQKTTDKGKQIMEGLLLSQYSNSPLLQDYINCFVAEMDILFEQVEEVHLGRFLENAVGKQLDVIGIILQQPRSVILPTQWFGLSDNGTAPPNVAGMANEVSPAAGGIFRDANVGEGDITPLDDSTYRRILTAKALVSNQDAASLSLAYFVVSTILGRVPSLFELRDADTVHRSTVENGEFTDGIDGWVEGSSGTGAVLETNVGWSPNYKNDGFVTIPKWVAGSGDWEVSFEYTHRGGTHTKTILHNEYNNQSVISVDNNSGLRVFTYNKSGTVLVVNSYIVPVDGETYEVSIGADGEDLYIEVNGARSNGEWVNRDNSEYISVFGAREAAQKLDGTLHNIRMTNGVDDRLYKSNLQADPSDSYLTLVDENGFKADEWTPSYDDRGSVDIPVVRFEGDFSIKQTLTPAVDDTMMSLGSGACPNPPDFWGFYFHPGMAKWYASFIFDNYKYNVSIPITPVGETVHMEFRRTGTYLEWLMNGERVHSRTTVTGSLSIDTIGARSHANGQKELQWSGNIIDTYLTDLTNPANSRYYPSVVTSAEQPEITVLEDVEYDEATAPFYTPAYGGANREVVIPEWTTGDGLVKFKFVLTRYNSGQDSTLIGSNTTSPAASFIVVRGTSQTQPTELYWSSNMTTMKLDGVEYLLGDAPVIELNREYEVEAVYRASGSQSSNIATIGGLGYTTGAYNLWGKIWDVELADNTDPTNSRFYPSLEYRADGGTSGTVLEATEGNIISDTFAEGWYVAKQGSISGNTLTVTNASDSGDHARFYTRNMPNDIPVTVSFDVVSYSGADIQVYVYREGAGDGSLPFGGADVGSRVTMTFNGTGNFNRDNTIYFYVPNASGQSFEVANIEITQSMDGELVNFPTGTEWTNAGLPNLTQGTMQGFLHPTWIQAPSTDGTLERFTSPVWDRLEGDGHLIVTPPNGANGYAEQVQSILKVRANENYDFSADYDNELLSSCNILVGTESDEGRYISQLGLTGSGTATGNFTPDLDEPVYVRLVSVEQNTWSTFDNVEVVNAATLNKRATELLLSGKDVSSTEVQLISYMSKYFVPAGITFNIRTI